VLSSEPANRTPISGWRSSSNSSVSWLFFAAILDSARCGGVERAGSRSGAFLTQHRRSSEAQRDSSHRSCVPESQPRLLANRGKRGQANGGHHCFANIRRPEVRGRLFPAPCVVPDRRAMRLEGGNGAGVEGQEGVPALPGPAGGFERRHGAVARLAKQLRHSRAHSVGAISHEASGERPESR
jgi:hypothetical protein